MQHPGNLLYLAARGKIMARQQQDNQNRSNNPIRPQIDVQKHLKGMDYPASREELVSHARENGAPDDVISLLEGMAEREFKSPVQVTEEISKNM
jgi:hypothetical protein